MRFRVTHLLAVTVFVAVFATALIANSDFWAATITMVSWLIYATLTCRAIAVPSERPVLFSAVVFGVSYFVVAWLFLEW
jgi:uncharacterized protein with PQ loop repeat